MMWCVCKLWLLSLARLFVPRRCAVCGTCLDEDEEVVCLACDLSLPRTGYHLRPDNPVECALRAHFPLVRASAYMYYRHYDASHYIVLQMKYGGRKGRCLAMGRLIAAELAPAGFFDGVDLLLPVPLHPKRQRSRGYNQSEWLARGVSAVTGIPVSVGNVRRARYTETQTRKSALSRWENVHGAFTARDTAAFTGLHVMLVDDVFTTGATLTACAAALSGVEGVRLSVLTLAAAGA